MRTQGSAFPSFSKWCLCPLLVFLLALFVIPGKASTFPPCFKSFSHLMLRLT